MQGIPTRSDAVKLDPEYARIVEQYNLLHQVEAFGSVFPSIHNYLNGLYHNAGVHYLAPPYELMWRIPAVAVPKKVRQAVDAPRVTNRLLSIIETQRNVINQARPLIDKDTDRQVFHHPDVPYDNPVDAIKLEHIVTPGYAPAWRYSFNTYELAMAILDDFESFIERVTKSRLVPFTQLSKINQYLKSIENSIRFVSDEARSLIWRNSNPEGYELRQGTLVNELYEDHKQIQKRSDLCIGFAETHFYQWMGTGMVGNPLPPLRDGQDGLLTFTALWQRRHYWYAIDSHLHARESMVINGVTYSGVIDRTHTEPLVASGDVPIEIANLIGSPIKQADGTIVEPESWARLEHDLVHYYARYRNELARDVLLESYDDDGDMEEPTEQKRLERLNYVLGVNSSGVDVDILDG